MICPSLQKLDYAGLIPAITNSEISEIRLDLAQLTNEDYYRDRLISAARTNNFGIILSHHDFNGCDSLDALIETTRSAFEKGADIAKIVTTAVITEDGIRTLKLYKHFPPEKLLAFSMGKSGRFTRILSSFFGAPFVYAALETSLATANGQFTVAEIKNIENSENYKTKINFNNINQKESLIYMATLLVTTPKLRLSL